MRMDVLTIGESEAWTRVVEQCAQYDSYHLPAYHALTQAHGEGSAHLFCHHEGPYTIAIPLLLRSLRDIPGIPTATEGWLDATSVYGYAGPIASHAVIPEAVVANFQAALRQWLCDMRVATVFSRLHPILPQTALLAGIGACQALRQTVSIDLALPSEVQRAAYRKNHKEGINKLRRHGVTCLHDREGRFFDDFVAIYHETMRRVGAPPNYFFSSEYFRQLWTALDKRMNFFVCVQEGRAVCGGIFLDCCGILQYHLGGTCDAALKLAPMKLLVDETRLWAHQRGLKTYHLGGGATAKLDDPLLHFKLGFSARTHTFSVWRWILAPEIYDLMCTEKTRFNAEHGLIPATSDYFPAYRNPTIHADVAPPHVSTGEPQKELELISQGGSA